MLPTLVGGSCLVQIWFLNSCDLILLILYFQIWWTLHVLALYSHYLSLLSMLAEAQDGDCREEEMEGITWLGKDILISNTEN